MLEHGIRNQQDRGVQWRVRAANESVLHLRQKVASEMSVPNDIMWDTHGHNICQSLYLMDHSICVGHLDSVIHTWYPMWSNHMVNLFMDLCWKGPKNITDKDAGCVSWGQGWVMVCFLSICRS